MKAYFTYMLSFLQSCWDVFLFVLFAVIVKIVMNKIDRKKEYWWSYYIILFVVGFPLFLNKLLFLPYPKTPSDLSNKEWLGFWASFVGSLIGGLATFFAVYLTLRQNLGIERDRQEKKRFEVMPLINLIPIQEPLEKSNKIESYMIHFWNESSEKKSCEFFIGSIFNFSQETSSSHINLISTKNPTDNKNDFIDRKNCTIATFLIKNIGTGPAQNLKFFDGLSPISWSIMLGKNDTFILSFVVPISLINFKKTIRMEFQDIYENFYIQRMTLERNKKNEIDFSPISEIYRKTRMR